MTIDERIERLTESQERLTENQQKLVESQSRLNQSQEKTQVILVQMLESIKRLERIAVAHAVDLDDVNARLDELEDRRNRRKPQ